MSDRYPAGMKVRPGTYVNLRRIASLSRSRNPLKPPFWAKMIGGEQLPYTLNGEYILNGEIRMNARKD